MTFLASIIANLLSWCSASFLGRVFDFLERSQNAAVEARRIDSSRQLAFRQADSKDLETQAQDTSQKAKHWQYWLLASPFVLTLWVYWAALTAYNLLWCSRCAFPQPWIIAGYPPPYDQWAMAMIGWLFGVTTLAIVMRGKQ